MKKISLFLLTALVMVSCKPSADTAAQLESHKWIKVTTDDQKTSQTDEAEKFTINFSAKDSLVSGVAACNSYFGRYELGEKGQIKIKISGSTMMACPDMNSEPIYFGMLSGVDAYKIENGKLMLYSNKKICAEFTEAPKVADMHNAQNSLDYQGTYKGTFPAADCPGINIVLTLNKDNTYQMTMDYIDRNSTFDEKGTYKVDGNMLTLSGDDGEQYYKVEENRLVRLDADKQPITGELANMYILRK